MKIYEIISESNSQLNEGGFSNVVKGALGKALFRKGADFEREVENLAGMVDKTTGKLPSHPYVDKQVQIYGDKIIKAAEKKYKQYINDSNARLFDYKMAKLKNATAETVDFIKYLGTAGSYLWWGSVVLTPLKEYYTAISSAEEMLKSGQITPEYFEQYKKQKLGIMIGKVGSQFLIGKFTAGVMSRIPFGIGKKIEGLIPAAQAYFMDYVNTPEGSNKIATVLLSVGLASTLGDLGLHAQEEIKNKIEEAKNYATGEETKTTTPEIPSNTAQPSQSTTTVPNTATGQGSSTVTPTKYGKTWDY